MIAGHLELLNRPTPERFSASDYPLFASTHRPLRADSFIRALIWTALLAVPAFAALQPLSEYDTWWHLRTGQWIVENGTVPATDPFTTFGEGKLWVAYGWLYGLLYYALYSGVGLIGILAYRVVLSVACVAALSGLVARREPRFAVAASLVGACGVALAPLFLSDRPWLFTILFCIWTLDAILRIREGVATRIVWLLPLVYMIWANLHIQFVHGLLILGLACVAPLIDDWIARLRGQANESLRNRAATNAGRKLVALTAACFLATFVNPYSWRVYEVAAEYSRQTRTYQIFAELHALDFRSLPDWTVLALTGTAVFALGRRPRVSSFEVLLLAAGAYFSFHSKHDLWFVVLAAACVFVAQRVAGAQALRSLGRARTAPTLAFVVLALLTLFVGRQRGLTNEGLAAKMAEEFPIEAAAFVEQQGYAGPIYHHIDWGGYLIWRLPHLQATVDGRTNLHGDKRVERCFNTCEGLPGWHDDPDLAAARLVVLQRRLPLASLLRRDPRFEKVYEDGLAIVFIAHHARVATR